MKRKTWCETTKVGRSQARESRNFKRCAFCMSVRVACRRRRPVTNEPNAACSDLKLQLVNRTIRRLTLFLQIFRLLTQLRDLLLCGLNAVSTAHLGRRPDSCVPGRVSCLVPRRVPSTMLAKLIGSTPFHSTKRTLFAFPTGNRGPPPPASKLTPRTVSAQKGHPSNSNFEL